MLDLTSPEAARRPTLGGRLLPASPTAAATGDTCLLYVLLLMLLVLCLFSCYCLVCCVLLFYVFVAATGDTWMIELCNWVNKPCLRLALLLHTSVASYSYVARWI